ncbi:sickle tail protein homolog isoform X3 [Mauremys reevesii]|uniref:sickle tail protein homolog isoform X3 n=1 Tax=Mauremys reevesii TaxID=260615 RepID=UPI00193F1A6C|nr:sickle tail protein homolog isoform X3 [Mauremys reevesii]
MEENESQKSELCLAYSTDSKQMKDQGKNNLHVTSLDDAECLRSKELLATGNNNTSNPKPTRNIPRRHTVGGPRSSKEILGMQTSEMDRKREAFLEHLKQKYPHHATAIMGHQERLRDQTRSPKLSQSPQSNLGDQAEHLSEASADSLEAMSEGDSPTPFSRGSRTRASLPVVRSANQTKERSLGVLYLQYGDETKQLRMPNEITSTDTIRALFVSAFPQQLTMKMLESPSVAIYIKDESRNIYYELNDVRNIQDRSFLKVYNKDPAHAFNHTSRTVNGDIRMQREIAYIGRDGPNTPRPGSATHPSHAIPSSSPMTAVPHSMPPSPSRIPYGGARPMGVPGNATIPRDRLSSVPASRSISPSPSAILERRDVKPDEDLSNKNIAQFRNEGLYADPYLYHEGRMSVAAPHTGHPLDVPDHIIAYHRSTMRSSNTYCSPSLQPEMMEQSLYRQKPRKYPDSHLPTLGSKTPPASPHRVTDMRLIDIHTQHNTHVPPHVVQPDRSSPSRQSFKKEPGAPMFVEAKARNAVGSPGMVEVVQSAADKQVFGYGSAAVPKDKETRERMQAMEKQIASLTGLVQSALFKGPNTSNSKDASSEKMVKTMSSKSNIDSAGAAHMSGGKNSLATTDSTTIINHPAPVGSPAMQVSLHDMRCNVSDLRLQLRQMKQLQLQNQEMLRAMMKKAELEINGKVIETVKRLEDPVQRQRILVEQERQKYLHEEEKIVKKLCELEAFVEELKKDSTATNKIVTLKDVEDGAFLLRQVGEAVATLKGEFPTLQNKMRAILRIEVEAVRFLKEEPHKLDSLLKRVRSMTDILTTLRRHVTEGLLKGVDPSQAMQYSAMEKATATEVLKNQEELIRVPGYPQQNIAGVTAEVQGSSVKSEVLPLMTVHHVQSSPVVIHQYQHSSALVNHTQNSPLVTSHSVGLSATSHHTPTMPVTVLESTAATQQSQTSQSPQVNGSVMQSLFIEEIHSASTRNRAVSIEKAEKKWEEKRQNLDHYNGKEFEKLLEEAQANIMKSIPNLEMPPQSTALPKLEAVDKLEVSEDAPIAEQEADKLVKSPPPPPPRRSYLPGSGLTTTRSGDVIYAIKKETTIVKEGSEDACQTAQSKVPKEDPASSRAPLPVTASATKDEEEEEGDRIMAELQAFQKCSFMDVNSNSHADQSRNDTHVKDTRPGALIHHKDKKVYGDTTGFPKDSDHPKEKRDGKTEDERSSDASSISENKIGFSMNENSVFSKDLFVGNKDYSNKNPHNISTNFSSVSLPENERRKGGQDVLGVHYPAIETGKQKLNYGILRHTDYDMPQNQPLECAGKCVPISNVSPLVRQTELQTQEASRSPQEQEMPIIDYSQVVLRPKVSKNTNVNYIEERESPASSPVEENPPTDNIAFMITKTTVQVLSTGEVHDIVNRKGGDVQTVNIDAKKDKTSQQGVLESTENEEPVVCLDKKPVIIIFEEPMDIRSAYKRLSTIFEECDEELEKMMTEEKIEEEEEDEENEISEIPVIENEVLQTINNGRAATDYLANHGLEQQYEFKLQSNSDSTETKTPEEQEIAKTGFNKFSQIYGLNSEMKLDSPDQFGSRQDAKKKFKFKFPKKQLAALTQAIRTGTKTGKKTLQVVVYEEEEEEDGTLKQHKEAKRFEITGSQPEDVTKDSSGKEDPIPETSTQSSRTDEIRKNTYRTLDSLEQTIKQLENTISEMSPRSVPEPACGSVRSSAPYSSHITQEAAPRELVVLDESHAASESPSSILSASRKGSSTASQTSRMPIPMATKSRQGSLDKAGRQHKLQDPRQYRQANGGAKKAGGDYKATSPTLPASKIPSFSPTSGKSSSVPASSGDSSNPLNPPTKTSIPSFSLLSPQTGRTAHSTSLIPSVSNGSLKFQNPTYTGKGHHLSFSLQTQNGRPSPPSSSSSPPLSTSPTSLTQGLKSIRTIHTPSFTSYKSQNGNASKLTPSAKETA